MRGFALVLALLALAGCSKPAGPQVPAPALADATADQSPTAKPLSGQPTPTAFGPMLAYAYEFGIEAPASRIRAMVERNQAACDKAGAAVCAVTGTSVGQAENDGVSATLTFKASPNWLSGFKSELAEDAKAAGGRITKTSVTSEDLSVQIVDASAHLKAQTALRDRLQDALQHRPGKTSDLVDVATALAKAQGDLDAMQSELALLRQRVTLSDVTISYHSSENFASESTWAPLSEAIGGFTGMTARALAAMVTIVGFLLPWAVVAAAVAWVASKLRKRNRQSQKSG